MYASQQGAFQWCSRLNEPVVVHVTSLDDRNHRYMFYCTDQMNSDAEIAFAAAAADARHQFLTSRSPGQCTAPVSDLRPSTMDAWSFMQIFLTDSNQKNALSASEMYVIIYFRSSFLPARFNILRASIINLYLHICIE
jgi:hypothetical protein